LVHKFLADTILPRESAARICRENLPRESAQELSMTLDIPPLPAPLETAYDQRHAQLLKRRSLWSSLFFLIAALTLAGPLLRLSQNLPHWQAFLRTIALQLVYAAIYILAAVLGRRNFRWAIPAGFALYFIDGLIFTLGRHWTPAGFHLVLLAGLAVALKADIDLGVMEKLQRRGSLKMLYRLLKLSPPPGSAAPDAAGAGFPVPPDSTE
jgi:hypothetical protein